MAFVELKDVYKYYQMGENKIIANNGITFEIDKGQFNVIVGPSGAGKSTLLNILGGMDKADDGQVIVDGKDIVKYDEKELTLYRRHDVGFVFQFYNLVPNLTTLENVELATELSKNPLDPKEILVKVGLKDRFLLNCLEENNKGQLLPEQLLKIQNSFYAMSQLERWITTLVSKY